MKKIQPIFRFGLILIFIAILLSQLFAQSTNQNLQETSRYACEEDFIEVLFEWDSKVRLRDSNLIDLKTNALEGLDQALSDLEWKEWYRLSDVPEQEIDSWADNGPQKSGRQIYNLNNIYRLRIPKGNNVWELSSILTNLPGVMSAIPVPKPVEPPIPPNYQSNQGYLNSSSSTPTGVDAIYSWTQTGGTGTGVTICDLEYSWNYNHADISKASGSQINSNVSDPFNDNNHGTAVIGQLVADNNGSGITGICYGAGLMTCGTYYGTPTPTWNVAGAIAVAVSNLAAGDIILLEQQWDYTGSSGYVPVEWYGDTYPSAQTTNSVYLAIVNAVSNGIHVVEAGGNGSYNTDGMTWTTNSGAIIVGAGGAYIGGTFPNGDLQKLSFSSYGTRFDLQGWGENVVTTGYGDLYSSEGVNNYFTSTFNGTSSASPIVAGALACAEGYYLANVSTTPPTPAYMRTHLSTYSTAQVTPPSGNIGPRPDINAAINSFPPPQQNYDWGDAMDPPYPTLSASTGANHLIGVLFLGLSVDPETDGQPTVNADGDDLDGNNDDDGVTLMGPLTPGTTITVNVVASAAGLLNAWIDFNMINLWADAGEQIFTDQMLTPGLNILSFTVPATAVSGPTYARFRLSTLQGLLFFGTAPDGEVEDYMYYIEELNDDYDWGDAPDPNYPTLSLNNGASHWIDGFTYMGNSVDGEADGQPDATATGDDLDIIYPPVNDDEDGVVFTSVILQGQNATVDVNASVPGILNAWIDFDGNGSWADVGEHIFIDFGLAPGINNLMYTIPATATQGNTFARFRFSTQPGLNFDGMAQDGEVEDYQVYIGIPTTDIQMDPDPAGSYVQNEVSMALVPGTIPGIPSVLLAAYNDNPYPGGPGLGISNSTDGGATWIAQQLAYPPDPFSGGNFVDMFDPSATADANGDLYVAHISSDYNWSTGPASGLFVHKSIDGGMTWNPPVSVSLDAPAVASPDPNYRFNDRCQIIADMNPASPHFNFLYVVWIKDRGWNMPSPLSDIYTSTSMDGGLTWTPPVTVNQVSNNMGNMPNPTIATDGTFYICWMDYNVQTGGTGTIFINSSPDGGISWLGADILVTTVNLPPLNLNSGTDVLVKGAAIIENSPFNPLELYIVYAEQIPVASDDGEILFIKSIDGGLTWSLPMIVNDDLTSNDQVLPWMDIKPNGTIDIVWYDRRNDPSNLNWDVYMATSADAGLSFTPNQQINAVSAPSPFTPSGYWMGEYLGLVVDSSFAYIGFTSACMDLKGDVLFSSVENPAVEFDYGDTKDPSFPTLLISNGARHSIDGVTFLGNGIDPEFDGLPDDNSLGDDNDGIDDEDGVSFLSALSPGSSVTVNVNASTNTGWLNAWIDFDGNGTWADPGDQVFIDVPLTTGINSLVLTIPQTAKIDTTYSRFRFSTSPGLSYSGPALDGEVEDYEVLIEGDVEVSLKVFAEGPFVSTEMNTDLNDASLLPTLQPYGSDPLALWYYTGTESVISIPDANITDWIVVEFRDAQSAALATSLTTISKQAAFLMKDGSIVATDGSSPVKVDGLFQHNLYVVIWHRNHLGLMSATGILPAGVNQYSYDFTTGAGQAYLNGQKSLNGTVYGMIGGDGDPDGTIDNNDKAVKWSAEAGTSGYLSEDYNMDSQVDNNDKDDIWLPNNGSGTKIPN